jgi:hypothetical protein
MLLKSRYTRFVTALASHCHAAAREAPFGAVVGYDGETLGGTAASDPSAVELRALMRVLVTPEKALEQLLVS